ncbi:MAG: 1-(5-phosphoribosyl)-5-[(5-phosphoribosylamino)methylideneamino]imidazole-4-carboxamide isomerase [Planctomycetaceae bacterium]|jgi:phosphoribosylformimino-5-aminoimidazole carboxamide ribotide isomerase|nr:1-(5-phosphoribosyl)-5-[(5-phosphoribosylamino)methylideneamino]imidazole-4-carboxamide isomerase [Planctomycetaceae bacterium]
MQILPAIDIRNGKCVRLKQGDYGRETVYGDNPVETALHWQQLGAEFLHIVDLDGAKDKEPVNKNLVCRMASSLDIPLEIGGGIRSGEAIQMYLDAGVRRVIIGTLALKEPQWFRQVCGQFPDRLVLGIDAKNGIVATEGWLETSGIRAVELAKQYADLPLAAVVYTDIAKDGMLEGPNFEEISAMQEAVPFPVVASGGVSTLADIRELMKRNIPACIIGKALYEGTLRLEEALKAVCKMLS